MDHLGEYKKRLALTGDSSMRPQTKKRHCQWAKLRWEKGKMEDCPGLSIPPWNGSMRETPIADSALFFLPLGQQLFLFPFPFI